MPECCESILKAQNHGPDATFREVTGERGRPSWDMDWWGEWLLVSLDKCWQKLTMECWPGREWGNGNIKPDWTTHFAASWAWAIQCGWGQGWRTLAERVKISRRVGGWNCERMRENKHIKIAIQKEHIEKCEKKFGRLSPTHFQVLWLTEE